MFPACLPWLGSFLCLHRRKSIRLSIRIALSIDDSRRHQFIRALHQVEHRHKYTHQYIVTTARFGEYYLHDMKKLSLVRVRPAITRNLGI